MTRFTTSVATAAAIIAGASSAGSYTPDAHPADDYREDYRIRSGGRHWVRRRFKQNKRAGR